jgi:hypothetical protein
MSGGDVSKGIDKMLMDKMKGNSKWVTPFEWRRKNNNHNFIYLSQYQKISH